MSRIQELNEVRQKINAEIRMLERDGPTQPDMSPQYQTATYNQQQGGQIPGGDPRVWGESPQRDKSSEEIIDQLFTYHPNQDGETALKYTMVRDAAKHLALAMWKACPYGQDRTAAIRKLREAVMTANSAISLNGLSL